MNCWLSKYFALLAAAAAIGASPCAAQSTTAPPAAEQVLADSAATQKHTFLVFHKDNGPLAQAMAATVGRGVASRSDRAAVAYVNVGNPQAAALVAKYGVERAPMPLTLAVAPNGAVTGAYPQRINDDHIAGSFATPALATTLKSLQDGKLVLVCFQHTASVELPAGVAAFLADPQFAERTQVVPVQFGDPSEQDFVRQLKLNPNVTQGATIAFFAPPGMLVGKFAAETSASELAAALHKAGKCCDDPNCKHNKAHQSPPPAESQHQASQRGMNTRN